MEPVVAARRPWAWAVIAFGVLLLALGATPTGPFDLGALTRIGAQTAFALIVVALGAAIRSGRPVLDALRLHASQPPIRPVEGATLIVGMLALSSLLDTTIDGFALREGSRLGEIDDALADLDADALGSVLVAIALAPALAEELLFRGYVLGALLSRVGPGWAIGISAALFGCAHLDPVHGTAAALLGVYLGALSVATGSIRICIAAHFCNNTFAVIGPALSERLGPHPILSAALSALLLIGGAGALGVLARRFGIGTRRLR